MNAKIFESSHKRHFGPNPEHDFSLDHYLEQIREETMDPTASCNQNPAHGLGSKKRGRYKKGNEKGAITSPSMEYNGEASPKTTQAEYSRSATNTKAPSQNGSGQQAIDFFCQQYSPYGQSGDFVLHP